MTQRSNTLARDVVFISKATPGDDEFVLWLAPRLEAAGYTVFADILTLEAGDRWRRQVTETLQRTAVKMLLCCRDSTLDKNGVQEEIGIAEDLVKELKDPRFIIPMRLAKFRKVFGIGEVQFIDFVGSWAKGLRDLLDTLKSQDVPCLASKIQINPNWENYKRRLAIKIDAAPETLTSNWLRISSIPDIVRYYQPPGSVNHALMEHTCEQSLSPAEMHNRGFFSFATPDEIGDVFANVGKFVVHSEHKLSEFLHSGSKSPFVSPREAQNLISSMYRRAWESLCRGKGLDQYQFATQLAFYVTDAKLPLGRKIPWGPKSSRRSSMLRNGAAGKVWQYGVSAAPSAWPYAHFKLKARVIFAELVSGKTGAVLADSDAQHRLRRSVCKGWRNKAWHGRLMAFVELLSGESPFIELPLSSSCALKLDAAPVAVISPVTTVLPNSMEDEAEETDSTTLGNFDVEDDG